MSFVANGITTPSNITITSGTFFPTISLDDIRNDARIDGSVTDSRLRQIVLEEVIDVNRLLSRLVMTADTLAELAKSVVDDKPDTVVLYFSAVANGVAAKTYEKYRNYDATNSGHKRADELTPSIDEYRRNKHWAIQQLLGENHTIVELI
ncbi:head completion/stabilization protein [Acinetobacter sp. VNK23]|uniref:head completion/stabilization protein n=1 Tax=Acinetobacter thutiue TaxID=2998078 RepID=UPI002575DE2B|nr:head completion/stabilization protein [Acinetobacter thutiue]MDM1022062.1 head completion/stabilization protein [Acinetobacter thutiue]